MHHSRTGLLACMHTNAVFSIFDTAKLMSSSKCIMLLPRKSCGNFEHLCEFFYFLVFKFSNMKVLLISEKTLYNTLIFLVVAGGLQPEMVAPPTQTGLGVQPPSLPGLGVPPHSQPGIGIPQPSQLGMVVPSQPGMGVPPPSQAGMGVPPPSQAGMGMPTHTFMQQPPNVLPPPQAVNVNVPPPHLPQPLPGNLFTSKFKLPKSYQCACTLNYRYSLICCWFVLILWREMEWNEVMLKRQIRINNPWIGCCTKCARKLLIKKSIIGCAREVMYCLECDGDATRPLPMEESAKEYCRRRV